MALSHFLALPVLFDCQWMNRQVLVFRPTSRLIIHKCCVNLCGSLWIFVDICGYRWGYMWTTGRYAWIFVDLCGSLWIFVDIASSLIYMLVGLWSEAYKTGVHPSSSACSRDDILSRRQHSDLSILTSAIRLNPQRLDRIDLGSQIR